jgi:cation transport ATPase
MYEADVAFVGLWTTSVATLVVAITPGLNLSTPAVLIGGVGAAASVGALVGSFCRGNAAARWGSCQAWARRNC